MTNSFKLTLASALIAGSALAASPKLICSAAKKEIDACCCEMKDGKSYCKLTGKIFDKCCCVPKEKADKKRS